MFSFATRFDSTDAYAKIGLLESLPKGLRRRLSGVESSKEVPARGRLTVALRGSAGVEHDPSGLGNALPFRRCIARRWINPRLCSVGTGLRV